jgi:hypothetical protein
VALLSRAQQCNICCRVALLRSWVGGKNGKYKKKNLTGYSSVRFRCAGGLRTPSLLAAPYQSVLGFSLSMNGTGIYGGRWRRCGSDRLLRFSRLLRFCLQP